MIVIGLTGGTGAGKSKASQYMAEKGYAVIDADQIGRDMTADGKPLLHKLNAMFGPRGEYGSPGVEITEPSSSIRGELSLNRQAISGLVFNDARRKKAFDELMHKEIIAAIDRRIEDIRSEYTGEAEDANHAIRGIIIDAPLLFEAGIQDRCDVVVLITADENIKIKRIMKRDGLTEEQIRARMRNQLNDESKAALSDYIIDNSGDYDELKQKIDCLIESLG